MKTQFVRTATLAIAWLTTASAFGQLYHRGSIDGCAGGNCQYGYSYADTYKQSYMDSRMWPKQYVRPARQGICQAFETMVNNGWRRQNLLGKYHFNADTAELTDAGKLKAKWVLTQAPVERRTVFIQRAEDDAITADRITSTQNYLAKTVPSGTPADVRETHIREVGRPAGAVDLMFTAFRENQSAPILPEDDGGSSEN